MSMSRVELLSKIGSDGVLRVTVPMAPADAGLEVRVTVEPIQRPMMTQEEWRSGILRMAGAWQGEFERPEQGELQEREPLS